MNKHLLTLVFCYLTITAFSQDIITTKRGDDIPSKVLEITSSEIKYKDPENMDGPVYVLDKTEVLMIRYENGYKDIFLEEPVYDTVNYYMQGQIDAFKYYRGYKPAATGTFITSLLVSPLAGLIPAIACSSTYPNDRNLNYPDQRLFRDQYDYQRGYTHKAKRMKQDKVWKNWGIALLINFCAIVYLSR
ncbi:MAG TPA: hypothetical protein VK172_10620 [Lentimicrobium sp.]|nr:hypothetical protein [Lentimicrobium sp.]